MPDISCIIPTYDNHNELSLTLDSLERVFAAIPNRDIELVVVDGCVEHSSRTLIHSRKFLDNFSLIYSNECDDGPYHAMNLGLTLASGRWIWFLNSGDQVSSFCEAKSLNSSRSIIVGSWLSSSINRAFYPDLDRGLSHLSDCEIGYGLCHQSMIFRTEYCSQRRFDVDAYRFAAELDFFLPALLEHDFLVDYQLQCLYDTTSGLSKRHAWQHWRETLQVYERYNLPVSIYRRVFRSLSAIRLQLRLLFAQHLLSQSRD